MVLRILKPFDPSITLSISFENNPADVPRVLIHPRIVIGAVFSYERVKKRTSLAETAGCH
jgi:hypothetical protein